VDIHVNLPVAPAPWPFYISISFSSGSCRHYISIISNWNQEDSRFRDGLNEDKFFRFLLFSGQGSNPPAAPIGTLTVNNSSIIDD